MRRRQDLGASPFLQSVTMIVTALSLGLLLTRFVDCPAHQGLMSFYDQATSTRRVAPKLTMGCVTFPSLVRLWMCIFC